MELAHVTNVGSKAAMAQEASMAGKVSNVLERGIVAEGRIATAVEGGAGSVAGKVTSFEQGTNVIQLEKRVSDWLGGGSQLMYNKAGDPIFLSNDGLRKVRFDFKRTAPYENPHMHLEDFVNGEWKEISRIYPIDVPHK